MLLAAGYKACRMFSNLEIHHQTVMHTATLGHKAMVAQTVAANFNAAAKPYTTVTLSCLAPCYRRSETEIHYQTVLQATATQLADLAQLRSDARDSSLPSAGRSGSSCCSPFCFYHQCCEHNQLDW
jgi:hypothetical protein